MNKVNINSSNCYNVYFDEVGYITYTRLVDNKLHTYSTKTDEVMKELSAIASMDNESFVLLCTLNTSCISDLDD